MKEMFVTITGYSNYHGSYPFKPGMLVRCEKEPDNHYDTEAIRCTLPLYDTVGYIANSTGTVAVGTMSAGRIYDRVNKKFYIRVMFLTHSKVICRIEDGEPNELKLELLSQLDDKWDEDDDEGLIPECGGIAPDELAEAEDM